MNTNSDDIASKIILQGVHVELTPAMQSVMREKFSILLRHSEYIVRVNVRLNRDQSRGRQNHYTATGQIEISGPDLVAHVEGDDAYSVIDGLVDKLDQLLLDRHERRNDKRNHPRDVDLDAALPKSRSN